MENRRIINYSKNLKIMKIFGSVVFKVAVFKMADELKLKYVVYANFYRNDTC